MVGKTSMERETKEYFFGLTPMEGALTIKGTVKTSGAN